MSNSGHSPVVFTQAPASPSEESSIELAPECKVSLPAHLNVPEITARLDELGGAFEDSSITTTWATCATTQIHLAMAGILSAAPESVNIGEAIVLLRKAGDLKHAAISAEIVQVQIAARKKRCIS